MPGRYESPLRDLVLKLDAVARAHPAYAQACPAMNHLRDHLSALARCEEVNHREADEAGIKPEPPRQPQQSTRYKPIEPGDPPRYLR